MSTLPFYWMVLACGDQPVQDPGVEPGRLLSRLSLDLRGVRPTPDELAAVRADPAMVDGYVEDWLVDPRFPDRIRGLYLHAWRLQAQRSDIDAAALAMQDQEAFLVGLGEEAIRMFAHLAATDRPYTDLFTADWTMADESLAAWYPVDYPAGASGWQQVSWQDGRPSLGILATNGLWWRYGTTTANANRGRANVISRMFLCNDYLLQPIRQPDDVDLTDQEAVADAISHNDACVACHVTLDPVGSYLWGFANTDLESPRDLSTYNPEHELWWEELTGVAPGWFGEPGEQVEDLGHQLAADPRIVDCAVETATELLLQRETTLDDFEDLAHHREAFLADDLRLRSLFRSILASDAYRAPPGDDPARAGFKLVDAELLVTQVEGITGLRFEVDGVDAFARDRWGLRSLARGGTSTATGPTPELAPTVVLVQQRLAEAAAWGAAARDAADPDAALTFQRVDFTEQPDGDRAAMAAQVQELWLRALGQPLDPDAAQVDLLLQLWADVHADTGDPVEAWAAVLAVILRHPDFLVY